MRRTVISRWLDPPTRGAALAVLSMVMGLLAGCDTAGSARIPVDLKERFPATHLLQVGIPGQAGAAGSGSEAAFQSALEAAAALKALGLLEEYLSQGGELTSDVSMTIALEGAPRLANQLARYTREHSRLDVERKGDHAFFYLQYDWGYGFDPDGAVGESRMVIEGSTGLPGRPGARVTPSAVSGLSSPALGYLRFHFNHRPEDTDAVRSAAQLDYNTGTGSLHLTYFLLPGLKGDRPVAFLQQPTRDGNGLLYASRRDEAGKLYYKVLAQYRADGSLAVWNREGKLWGCYDPTGAELGNEQLPAACASFSEKFTPPPAAAELWPSLPGGIP